MHIHPLTYRPLDRYLVVIIAHHSSHLYFIILAMIRFISPDACCMLSATSALSPASMFIK